MNARYAIAYGVEGFRRGGRKTAFIRVRVTRVEGSYVWCVTADLADAGTSLVLDASQIEYELEFDDSPFCHKDGLVAIG